MKTETVTVTFTADVTGWVRVTRKLRWSVLKWEMDRARRPLSAFAFAALHEYPQVLDAIAECNQ